MDFSNAINDTLTQVLLIILALSFLYLCFYYCLIWLRVGCYKNKKLPKSTDFNDRDLPSVSVVIVAHNDEDNLRQNLPSVLEQDYPNFEVVVVDYMSRDDTQEYMGLCSEKYPNIKPVLFGQDVNFYHGKKYPLSIGIKSASKDIILLIEPDCHPFGNTWIREMVCGFMRGSSIVMGCSVLRAEKKFFDAFRRYDNMVQTASYLGNAIMGNPYTATGRNLAYRRDFFFNSGALISHYRIPEGADSLFVNRNATRSNTTVVYGEDSLVECCANQNSSQWRQMRKETFRARHFFRFRDKLRLSCYPLSQVCFLGTVIALFVMRLFPWELLLALFSFKIIWQTVCCFVLAKRMKVKSLYLLSIFFELYFLFANTFLFLFTLRRKK